MPAPEVLIAFTVAALLMNISPGPSNLYVMARSIAQGTRGGIAATLGLAVGSLVHVVAAVLGLSAAFTHSPALYTLVKLAGAFYLIYLGISYWKTKTLARKHKLPIVPQKSLPTVFLESIVVEITNPKTALFFIALLPQFVAPESGPVSLQMLVLGLIVTVSAIPCDLLVSLSSSKASSWLGRNEHARVLQKRLSGSILFGMGACIITDEIYESAQRSG